MTFLSMVKSRIGNHAGWLLVVFGVLLLIIGLAVTIHRHQTELKPPSGAIISSAAPSEVRPSVTQIATYKVPPNNPKYIAIPAIGITNTPILSLGLLKSGAIATPDNIYEAGWYRGSSLPGKSGAMFIYGHVSSWTADGIFYNLKKLVAGNKIIITRGDNRSFTYQVIFSKVYPYNDVNMAQVLSSVKLNTPGLNLMTCTGKVIPGTNEFNERLVVFANLVSS